MATPQVKDLVLHSPAGAEFITYSWPLQHGSGSDKHDKGIDIIETIRHVCLDVPEICKIFENFSFNEIDTACYKTMYELVEKFNRAVENVLAIEKKTLLPNERLNKYASPCLLRHILQLAYNSAVVNPDKLNQYEPFSPEVYGETSYDLVCQMIKHVEITPEDLFIDLGSGVGQVVLQMAGTSPLKSCIGIEKADVPSRYAELMDSNFRSWMNWFGKRYGEYQLIKGDFLADEYREKITSASLVFVNNFAFGPNVDHQLKERFADLKDGAKIVSSKSFCPLNFRTTERNLSDIGTIMHISEMSPLKGSVSWTGKPVSYYLHLIDRTKLERYFQRLNGQKAKECDQLVGGNTRTTRERNKRETKMLAEESSTETEGEVTGPTTRRAWSDWCSSKGKSSQSDDEENNNFSTNSGIKFNSQTLNDQKKRKKLTRKAANCIGNKNSIKITEKQQKQKKGKIRKRRGRRNIKINGLDILHKQTLLSTSAEMMSKKLPPAPGCIDQQLTSLTGNMCHEELDIPKAPSKTPYGLVILLQVYKEQFMHALEQMKSKENRDHINIQVEKEKERNQKLRNRASQLEKQIKVLIDDSVALLKVRMNELGISMTSQNDLLAKAKEIVGRHKELQLMAAKLQSQVNSIEQDQKNLVIKHVQNLAEKYVRQKTNGDNFEITPATSHELVLKEIANTLAQRKKLHAQVNALENEVTMIDKSTEERKAAALLLATQSPHLTITSVSTPTLHAGNHILPLTTNKNSSNSSSHSKSSSRRNREHRSRSQEWPDVPDVGKIEENNPEILAQKILEKGRQIEAGKFITSNNNTINNSRHKDERKLINNSGDSVLMPAPSLGTIKSVQNQYNYGRSSNINTKCSSNISSNSNSVSPTSKLIQESPKVVNFEDRLKSIITSVLNEDQEQRKAAQQTDKKPNQLTHNSANKIVHTNNTNNNNHNSISHQQNINNILAVVTQGLTRLNSTTTISPITPPPYTPGNNVNSSPSTSSYKQPSASVFDIGNKTISGTSFQPNSLNHGSNSLNIQTNFQKFYDKNLTVNIQSGNQLDHNHLSPSTTGVYASNSIHQHQITPGDLSYRRSLEHKERAEFKPPDHRYDKHSQSYEENNRRHSTSSDHNNYFTSNRERIYSQQPSRPSSRSSQPDYTQVSPAKMALRRHLSQEKLAQQHSSVSSNIGNSLIAPKTIGDLVNGEIERTLEISHQSIINAAINMSTVGTGNSAHTNSIINTNIPRPERVNIRLLDESNIAPYNAISRSNSCESRKSPIHLHGQSNLATLAHVAYNHKLLTQQNKSHHNHISNGLPNNNINNRSTNYLPSTTRSYGNSNATVVYQHQNSRNTSGVKEQFTNVQLPRAEMKPYLESYFTDEHKPITEDRPTRLMNGNPPLEGLAASLQARVIASLKIKEENEERQRRSEMYYQNVSSSNSAIIQPSQIKTEAGIKRSSPVVQHPRPQKVLHFSESHDNMTGSEIGNQLGRQLMNSVNQPLMSPEINSFSHEERIHQQHNQRRNDDDDVLPDDESHWQDRISSGFDRLVAFASTELDKTRRSIDNDIAPSISCNTSPDSGITHSSNSDTRTILSSSSSSSSSQLDIAIVGISNGNGCNTNLNTIRNNNSKCLERMRTIKISPADTIDSPPLSEDCLPRTPSPTTTPPLVNVSTTTKLLYSSSINTKNVTQQNTLKIPLKYQRQLKLSSEKHYKKKFRERTWEYDYDDFGYDQTNIINQNNSDIVERSTVHHHHKSSKFRPKGKDWIWSNNTKSKTTHDDPTAA